MYTVRPLGQLPIIQNEGFLCKMFPRYRDKTSTDKTSTDKMSTDKTSTGQKVYETKRLEGQKVYRTKSLRDKTSTGTKRQWDKTATGQKIKWDKICVGGFVGKFLSRKYCTKNSWIFLYFIFTIYFVHCYIGTYVFYCLYIYNIS